MSSRLLEAWGRFLDECLAPACALCGRGLAAGDASVCRPCDARLPAADDAIPPPAPLSGWAAGASDEGEAAALLRRFKYPGAGLAGLDPRPAALAGHLIARAAARAPAPPPDLLVPVPLHPTRWRARGMSPPASLARALARRLGRPVRCDLLVRLRDTPSQTGLGRRERARNVAGAFACRRPAPACVWLVDDLVTTGHTLAAAARALERAGARRVVGVCALRRPPPA